MAGRTRLEAYLLLAAVAGGVGFFLGHRHASPPGCDDVGECSLGVELGVVWAAVALLLTVVVAGFVELVLRLSRPRTG
jgi:hypothetical protein